MLVELSTVQRASEFSVDENVMAVSPRPNKSATPKVALSVSTGPGHGTPKKLRFVMDEKPEELEAPTFERDSPVPSPKKLRFSDSGAKTSSMKTSESPSSRKSALARSPIRPVKNRSPTPERFVFLYILDVHSPMSVVLMIWHEDKLNNVH